MKAFKRITALILTVLMLMPMMTAWVNAATISSGLDGEISRDVKTLYPGVTRTNIKTSSSSKYQTQNFNIVEFDPKQADLYVDVTNTRDYANQSRTTLKTVTEFNATNNEGKTAIAAINGDLWMMSSAHSRVEGSGTSYGGYTDAVVTKALTLPRGFNVYDGEIITSAHMVQETPFEGEFWSFGMTADHVPMIGCPELEISVTNNSKGAVFAADGLNRLPANEALVVYSDKGCLNNYALSDAYEVVIDVPYDYTVKHGASVTGTVTEIYSSSTASDPTMQANRIILTARGTKTMLLNQFAVGNSVTLDFSVTERYGRNTAGWQNVQNAVGGHMPFVVDGVKWETGTTTNYPTTIVGIKNDGNVVFIANDGRQSSFSTGLDFNDYWDFADDMDLNTAFILDGGGSTTLVELTDAGYAVTNSPSDGSARSVVNSVILSAGPVDTNRGSYNVRYPSENIDLTNINFATDDGFMLLTNFSETRPEKTVYGAKLTVSDYNSGPSASISYGLPNTASSNPNSVLGSEYSKLEAGQQGYRFLVLDMNVVTEDRSDVQNQVVWFTAGNRKGTSSETNWGFHSACNNSGFKKYLLDMGVYPYPNGSQNQGAIPAYTGSLNTVHLQYLFAANGITVNNGDYVILRSARFFTADEVQEASEYFGSNESPTMITVDLNANGGTVSQDKKHVILYDSYGSFPVPTREGYKFTGWYTAADGGSEVTADTTVTDRNKHTLFAHWEELEVSEQLYVTFDPNGGVGLPGSYPIISGQTYESAIKAVRGIGMHDIPTKKGATFDGWYCEETGYKLKLSDTFNSTENLTFKAVWKQRAGQYTCTASSTLTIRSGAGTNYGQLGTIPNGGIFEATGEYDGKWIKGTYNGITGWASTTYLEYIQSYSSDVLRPLTASFSRLGVLNVTLEGGGSFNKDSGAVSGSVSANGIGLDGNDSSFDIYIYQAINTPTDTYFNNNYFGTVWQDGEQISDTFYVLGDLLSVIVKSCTLDGTQVDALDFIGMKDFTVAELTGTESWMDKDLLNGSSYDVTIKCNSYTLTLDTAGGAMPEGYRNSYTFKGGNQKFVDVIGGFPVPVRDGYKFTGWRWFEHSSMCWEESWGTQPYTFGKSITLTALWEKVYEEGKAPELGEDENGKHIYVDGEMMTDGLYEVDGDYYYALRDGTLAADMTLYTYHNKTDLVSSYRYFAEDCKMDKDGWLTLDDDSGRAYYFNSAYHAVGANRIDGNYYFFRINSGEMVRNETLFIPKGNPAGLEAGVYSFGEDGIMYTAAMIAQEPESTLTGAATATDAVSGFENYVQSTEILAINTAAPVSLPEAAEGDDSDDDE
ncbi:MAG: InlB B-repeat-containing protein [Clostridia bacterium]|nr:InlB B-repeat-containing protein [Clostridia bacterium]